MIPKIIHYCWFGRFVWVFTKKMYRNQRWAYLSDYMRFYALNKYGGIYFDTDVEVLKSFDDLLENEFFIGYELENRKHIECL